MTCQCARCMGVKLKPNSWWKRAEESGAVLSDEMALGWREAECRASTYSDAVSPLHPERPSGAVAISASAVSIPALECANSKDLS